MAVGDAADWQQRGLAHQREGRAVDAMLCYRRAIALEPGATDARYRLGETQWALGRIADALGTWRETVRLAPGHIAAQLALCEASLATGDLSGAAEAGHAARALAPEDATTRLLAAVAAFAARGEPELLGEIAAAIASGPGRLASSIVATPLAFALDRVVRAPHSAALIDALVPHLASVAMPLLRPLARALFAREAPAAWRAARPALIAAALQRPLTAPDLDVLREIACVASDDEAEAARDLARRYAMTCAAARPAVAPLTWPRRAAGERLRIVALLPAEVGATHDALGCLAGAVADRAVDVVLLADPGVAFTLPDGLGASVVRPVQRLDADVAAAVAAEDPDLMLDFAGLGRASGALLALRPARRTLGVAPPALSNDEPLVDEFVAADALRARIADAANAIREQDTSRLGPAELASLRARAIGFHRDDARDEAEQAYAALLDEQPDDAATLHFAATLARDRGERGRARDLWARAIAHAPRFAAARVAAAQLERGDGRPDAGLALVRKGLELAPNVPELWRALGDAARAMADVATAKSAYARALALAPADPQVHFRIGLVHHAAGEHGEAARAWQRALAFDPGLPEAHFNLGVMFQQSGRLDAAIEAYRAVLARDSRHAAAYSHLGEALYAAWRIDEWLANFERFEAACPESMLLAVQALEVCQHAGQFDRVERYLDGLRRERFRAADARELTDALEQLLFLLLYFDVEPEMMLRMAQTYDTAAAKVYGTPLPRPARRRPGKLRIGYLSADLRNHVMGKQMWSAIEGHDRTRFALHFYSLSGVRDAWTERFAGVADRFEVLDSLPERDAAARIAGDDLDILVDLSGHTKGGKPGILAFKPARVQITHVASAGSVGLSTVDFKLTDRQADVPDNQSWMLERLLAMEGCAYPYRHIEAATLHPFQRGNFGLSDDALVIGAFVTPMKLSRRCLALWRDVLARVPRARLALSPVHVALRGVYERIMEAAGIARDRLVFLPQGRDEAEGQGRYALVDFVLDTMPYGGVNGVIEPLDAGVPVVTLAGKRHGERTAASILFHLGVTQTIAHGGREYVELAVRLADDRAFRDEVRSAIRRGLAGSPLVDRVAHTRHLEAAYLAALREAAPGVIEEAGLG